LHAVQFMVVGVRTGVVLSIADDKPSALSQARQMLRAANDTGQNVALASEQLPLWTPDDLPATDSPSRRISRRRRAIFENSNGKCHYCGTALALEEPWHVEHQLPRALGGSDDRLNLVAACVECNLAKGDRTAIEFLARTTAE
jgi:5-methylcytosine-specific restriction endonuclease McrA